MKATLTALMRNDRTEEIQTVSVVVETANTDQALFAAVTHLAASLHGFAPRGSAGNWLPMDVTTRVTDCPAGFFAKHQEPQPQKDGDPHG